MARTKYKGTSDARPRSPIEEPTINRDEINPEGVQTNQSRSEPSIKRLAESVASDDVDPERIREVIEAEVSGDGVIIPEKSPTLPGIHNESGTSISYENSQVSPSEVTEAQLAIGQNQEINSADIRSFGRWISGTACGLLVLHLVAMVLGILGPVVGTASSLTLGFIAIFAFFIQRFISEDG